MLELIIGNLCSRLAMITDSIGSTRKTARGVLAMQSLSQVFFGAGAIVLKGYSAAVQNGLSIVRNFFAMSGKKCSWLEWLLVALGVVLGLGFNNLGLVGLLPVVANFTYSIAVFRFKENEYALKTVFLTNVVMFIVFNAFIYNIVGVVANAVVLVMTAVALLREHKSRRAA